MIRPCRESITGWTRERRARPGNHSSLELNEHGPALKVFWIPAHAGIGREASATAACQVWGGRSKRLVTKKTEPEGAGQETSGPLLSVRTWGWQAIGLTSARTRWVTERIASVGNGSPRPIRNPKQRKRRFESGPGNRFQAAVQPERKKPGRTTFFLLIRALTGDPVRFGAMARPRARAPVITGLDTDSAGAAE